MTLTQGEEFQEMSRNTYVENLVCTYYNFFKEIFQVQSKINNNMEYGYLEKPRRIE